MSSAVLKTMEGPRPPKSWMTILGGPTAKEGKREPPTMEAPGGTPGAYGGTEKAKVRQSPQIFMKKEKYKSVKQITITLNWDVYRSALAWAGKKMQKISAYIEWALKMQEAYNRKHYKEGEIWVSDIGRWMTRKDYANYLISIIALEEE